MPPRKFWGDTKVKFFKKSKGYGELEKEMDSFLVGRRVVFISYASSQDHPEYADIVMIAYKEEVKVK